MDRYPGTPVSVSTPLLMTSNGLVAVHVPGLGSLKVLRSRFPEEVHTVGILSRFIGSQLQLSVILIATGYLLLVQGNELVTTYV